MKRSYYTSKANANETLNANGYNKVLNFENQLIETAVYQNENGAVIRIVTTKLSQREEDNTLVQVMDDYKEGENRFCDTVANQLKNRI